VDARRAQLARHGLRDRAQAVLRRGEGGEMRAAAQRRGRAPRSSPRRIAFNEMGIFRRYPELDR